MYNATVSKLTKAIRCVWLVTIKQFDKLYALTLILGSCLGVLPYLYRCIHGRYYGPRCHKLAFWKFYFPFKQNLRCVHFNSAHCHLLATFRTIFFSWNPISHVAISSTKSGGIPICRSSYRWICIVLGLSSWDCKACNTLHIKTKAYMIKLSLLLLPLTKNIKQTCSLSFWEIFWSRWDHIHI